MSISQSPSCRGKQNLQSQRTFTSPGGHIGYTLMPSFNKFTVRLVLEKVFVLFCFLPSPQNAKRYLTKSFVMLWYLQTRWLSRSNLKQDQRASVLFLRSYQFHLTDSVEGNWSGVCFLLSKTFPSSISQALLEDSVVMRSFSSLLFLGCTL